MPMVFGYQGNDLAGANGCQGCSVRVAPTMKASLNFRERIIQSDNFSGAGCRSRTRDLMITNQLLYQLS